MVEEEEEEEEGGAELAKEGGGRLGKAVKSIILSSSPAESGRGKMVRSVYHKGTNGICYSI